MTDEIEFFSTTVLCVREDGTVLGAARRDIQPTNWGLPGGKLDDGEDAIDAAIRETFEETGVTVVLDPVPLYWGPDTSSSGVIRYCVTYLATEYEGDPLKQEGEGDAAWITWQDLLDGIFGSYNAALRQVWLRNPRSAVNTRKAWVDDEMRHQETVYRMALGVTADDMHRARCREQLGHGRCICADYAAVTALLHPDCPVHGYVTERDPTPT